MAISKKNLEEKAKSIGEGTGEATSSAAKSYNSKRRARKTETPPAPPTPDEITTGENENEPPATRQLISAWVDRDVWSDIRGLAQYRAAKGGVNHLGQAMSAGRLVEEALRQYLDANRAELEKWRKFLDD